MRKEAKVDKIGLRHLIALRCDHGNMLMLVGLLATLLILVIAVGLSLQYYFFSNKNLQFCADQFAISAAVNLNNSDRIGQINNLVANSRELIFNSNASYKNIIQYYPQFTNLSNRFFVESQQGADLVEKERQQLLALTVSDVQNTLIAANNSGYFGQAITLPWAKSGIPQIMNLRLGSIKQVESNVLGPYGNDALLRLDISSSYVNPISHLYYGNTVLKLPEDSSRNFYIASLPAPGNGIVAPVKLASSQVFERSADILNDGQDVLAHCQQLPSAVQADLQLNVTNRVLVEVGNMVTVESTAATNGAAPIRSTAATNGTAPTTSMN